MADIECTEDEYDALARGLHESIAEGQSIALTAKMLRLLAPTEDSDRSGVESVSEYYARARYLAGSDPVTSDTSAHCPCWRYWQSDGRCVECGRSLTERNGLAVLRECQICGDNHGTLDHGPDDGPIE